MALMMETTVSTSPIDDLLLQRFVEVPKFGYNSTLLDGKDASVIFEFGVPANSLIFRVKILNYLSKSEKRNQNKIRLGVRVGFRGSIMVGLGLGLG